MNTTFDILVIILSVLLAIYLTLSIIAIVAIYRLVQAARRVVAKGEHMVESAEEAAAIFKNFAGPMTTFKAFANIIEAITKHKKKGD